MRTTGWIGSISITRPANRTSTTCRQVSPAASRIGIGSTTRPLLSTVARIGPFCRRPRLPGPFRTLGTITGIRQERMMERQL
jgi:hypothetical protein